ncbi:TadE family protein [Streptomyces lasiicapitis]|uniref:Septum formation initiator n=1 Tax=Streptomyces lasiicapitis TaxID=1923961 RepID=A0ABQ2LHX4_9ACTN|nr:septum formation initiator [Streptomyces lasiicapitis]
MRDVLWRPSAVPHGYRRVVGRLPAPRAVGPRTAKRRHRFDDAGVSILEFAGYLPILLIIGLAAIQLGLVGYAANQAGSGARAAARVASQGEGGGEAAGHAAMHDSLDATVSVGDGSGETTTATVTVQVPTLLPFVDTDWSVEKSATMPNDDPDAGG